VDVSHLTVTQGAVALGLDTLAAVIPPHIAHLLDTSHDITVFGPTDEAFAAIPESVLTAIVGDPAVLEAVLGYHVSPDEVDPRMILRGAKAETLIGQDLFITRGEGGPMVNQSMVGCEGYRTANGVVWVIDSVVLPQF
jgi:uncharacterized surface protein with fasciclin (FAS1) repeats